MIRLLFIGDIVGRPGRDLVRQGLRGLVDYHRIDLVIANAENSAAGFGITREIGDQLLDWGVDVMTSGNHIWDKKEALDYIGAEPRLLRPANYPAGAPGNGAYLARTRDGRSVGIVNVMGRVFMLNIDDPFTVVLREIQALKERTRVVFVDFHAEATSEKIPMAGRVARPFKREPGPAPEDAPGPARPLPVRPATNTEPRTTNAERPAAAAATTRRVLSVTELTVRVRDLLEAEFFEVWVEGEL